MKKVNSKVNMDNKLAIIVKNILRKESNEKVSPTEKRQYYKGVLIKQ